SPDGRHDRCAVRATIDPREASSCRIHGNTRTQGCSAVSRPTVRAADAGATRASIPRVGRSPQAGLGETQVIGMILYGSAALARPQSINGSNRPQLHRPSELQRSVTSSILVSLAPGPDRRVLGIPGRVRNERVAQRAGTTVVPMDALVHAHGRLAVI